MQLPHILAVGLLLSFTFLNVVHSAEPADKKNKPSVMNNQRLGELIKRLDQNTEGKPGYWTFKIEGQTIQVITDEKANRMRIISPIAKSEQFNKDQLYRLMQANFDSTLDARYSIAKGIVWSAYLHPLASLTDKDFVTAVGQVVNLVKTFGTSFSSGLLIFQGGDSKGLERRKLIDKLLEKGQIT